MLRPHRPLIPLTLTALTLSSLTACGDNYDPCWVEPEVMEELFFTSTVSQSLNTGDPTVSTSGYTVTAEAGGDRMCSYELTPEATGPSAWIVLHRVDEVDAQSFEEHRQEAENSSDPRVFVEEHRDIPIVYSSDTARAVVGDHYYWSRYQSSARLRSDRGSDAQPLMQYVAGTRGGSDIDAYQAWLADEAERQAEAAAAEAAERAEQDYAEGHDAGLEDGEYEAMHGYPPQHYHRALNERSEDWLRGFEEGKEEGLASGVGPIASAEGLDSPVDWEDEYQELFSDSSGPFDEGPESPFLPSDPYQSGYDLGRDEGYWDGADQYPYTVNSASWNDYTDDAERQDFTRGYEEGYREGYREGWLGVGHPEIDLPSEAQEAQ